MYTIIDVDDLQTVINFPGQWCVAYHPDHNGYYAKANVRRGVVDEKTKYTALTLHKYLMNPHKGNVIDHINHDALDNRRCNLREIPYAMNSKNRSSRNSNNKSGYRNVFWNTELGKWEVSLCRNYKRVYAGYFDDVDEAGKAAADARERYYGACAGEN